MSADERKRNTAIPEYAIEGAAGRNEKFIIEGYQIKVAHERNEEIPTKKNTRTLVENPNQRQGEYSIDLQPGMSIPAKDGGIEINEKKQGKDEGR